MFMPCMLAAFIGMPPIDIAAMLQHEPPVPAVEPLRLNVRPPPPLPQHPPA
jgi:hypothetical protein